MTTSQPESTYTANQVADALGVARQTMVVTLKGVPRSARVLRHGNMTYGFTFAALPGPLQQRLEEAAKAKGCRNALALLNQGDGVWMPDYALSVWPSHVQVHCYNLREVFREFLQRRADGTETRHQQEWEQAAQAKYKSVFSCSTPPCGKWLRTLFKRAVDRDRGNNDWERLELWLPLGQPPKAKPVAVESRKYNMFALAAAIEGIASKPPNKLTVTERQSLFDHAFCHAKELAEQFPGEQEAVARAVRAYLLGKEPRLARTADALERAWRRKAAAWDGTSRAIADQRPANSGNAAPDLEADIKKLQDLAWNYDGNISRANRELRKRNELSPQFCERFAFDIRTRKSQVPERIRALVKPMLEKTLPYRHGKWRAQMDGPHISRDHSDHLPGDVFTADDVAWNSYFWFEDENGFQITRGECLVFLDCRSLYPLDYLVLTGHYNGEHIRRGILRVHDQWGLPHDAFHLERGAWESRLLKASQPGDFLPWHEYELGFTGGLGPSGKPRRIISATTPRAKLIEGIFKIIQDELRCDESFVGFNERDYKQERLQGLIARVRRGTLDPRTCFHSLEGWVKRIGQTFMDYLHETQNGKILDGFSPAELWSTRRPLEKLPDEGRYLIASHCVRARVTRKGVRLTIRGKSRFYFDATHSGQLVGQDVLAFYNVETPELLTCTDLARQNPFTLREVTLPAFSATKEQFAQAKRAVAGHMLPGKIRFGEIQHPERSYIVRDNCIDDKAKDVGRHIQDEQERHQEEQQKHTRALSKARRAARELGVSVDPSGNLDEIQEGLELEREARAKLADQEQT